MTKPRLECTVTGRSYAPPNISFRVYEAILEAEEKGLIAIMRYEEMPEKMREWIRRTILKEYEENADHPEYRHFLKGNFPDILEE